MGSHLTFQVPINLLAKVNLKSKVLQTYGSPCSVQVTKTNELNQSLTQKEIQPLQKKLNNTKLDFF